VVIGGTGHQDLPAPAIDQIRRSLERELASESELAGVCALAAGADQLFAAVVLAHGGDLHVVVPCSEYEQTFTDARDLDRYRSLLARADRVTELDYERPSEDAFYAAGKTVVDACQRLIAIWDGKRARGRGGTADVVDYARCRDTPVAVIWPVGVAR